LIQVPENGGDYINRLSMRQELSCIIGDKTAISASPLRPHMEQRKSSAFMFVGKQKWRGYAAFQPQISLFLSELPPSQGRFKS